MALERTPDEHSADDFLTGAEKKVLTAAEAAKPEAQLLASQIQDWYHQEKALQAENRMEMATDAAFYDGDQWEENEIEELEARNQYPSVINLVKPTIDWLTGTEKRARTDWKVLPTRGGDEEDAKTKTALLKYIVTNNHGEYKKSQAFAQAVKVGVGWREFGVRGDLTDDPIYIGFESWRNVIYDSQANDPMFIEDGRYIFRKKLVDLDVATAMFPNRADELKRAALTTYDSHWDYTNSDVQLYYQPREMVSGIRDAFGTHHNRRLVVPLVECWYRKPVKTKHIKKSDQYDWGTAYDENDEGMKADVEDARTEATLYDKTTMQMYVCMFTDPGFDFDQTSLLFNCKSPYKHNRFPFVPIWAYRKDSDNRPYGVIRNQRDPQKDFNKRHSKAQFILATRGVIYESGAIDDEDALAEEIARPDFIIKKNNDKDLEIVQGTDLAKAHIDIANLDERYIRQASGVTGENMGLETNATSGIAIERRQNEGGVVTEDLFDNSAMHDQVSGEILLSLVEQYMDLPLQVPHKGKQGQGFLNINWPAEDGSGLINDITMTKGKFAIDEQDYNATVRQSMFEELMRLIGTLDSEIALQLLDAVIELSDIPERREIVRRIRQINGHKDPDDISEEDMENEERAKEVAREEAARIQAAAQEAEIRKKNSDAAVQEGKAAVANIDALNKALETAGLMLVVAPQQVQMADSMVQEGKETQPQGQEPEGLPQQ